jgi:hypothetical protein
MACAASVGAKARVLASRRSGKQTPLNTFVAGRWTTTDAHETPWARHPRPERSGTPPARSTRAALRFHRATARNSVVVDLDAPVLVIEPEGTSSRRGPLLAAAPARAYRPRKVIAVLRREHMREQPWTGQSARERSRRRGALGDALAVRAGRPLRTGLAHSTGGSLIAAARLSKLRLTCSELLERELELSARSSSSRSAHRATTARRVHR